MPLVEPCMWQAMEASNILVRKTLTAVGVLNCHYHCEKLPGPVHPPRPRL